MWRLLKILLLMTTLLSAYSEDYTKIFTNDQINNIIAKAIILQTAVPGITYDYRIIKGDVTRIEFDNIILTVGEFKKVPILSYKIKLQPIEFKAENNNLLINSIFFLSGAALSTTACLILQNIFR